VRTIDLYQGFMHHTQFQHELYILIESWWTRDLESDRCC
jgi:hypothetical protein